MQPAWIPAIATLFNTVVSAVLGFGAAILAEPLRRKLYQPKLRLEFGSELAYQAHTPCTA
jgi:hypothetical protein